MVGDTGIEPVTPSMSTKCSTAELIALKISRTSQCDPSKKRDAGKPAPVRGSIKGVVAARKAF